MLICAESNTIASLFARVGYPFALSMRHGELVVPVMSSRSGL
jgi:hypothetical protein